MTDDGVPPRRFFKPGSGGLVQRGLRQLQKEPGAEQRYNDVGGVITVIEGEENDLVKTDPGGWNAYWQYSATELRTYLTKRRRKPLTLPPSLTLLIPHGNPRNKTSGVLVYRTADRSQAYYVYNNKITELKVFALTDTKKEFPLFPKTGTTIAPSVDGSYAVYFPKNGLFISAIFNAGSGLRVWVIDLIKQQLIHDVAYPPIGFNLTYWRPFIFQTKTEAWSLVLSDSRLTATLFSTSDDSHILDTTSLNFFTPHQTSWVPIGLVNGLPTLAVYGAIGSGNYGILYVINKNGAVLIEMQPIPSGTGAVNSIYGVQGTTFNDKEGDYYELIYTSVFRVDANVVYNISSYSSRTGLSLISTVVAPNDVSSIDTVPINSSFYVKSKDMSLENGYIHDGHYYAVYRFFTGLVHSLEPNFKYALVSKPYGLQTQSISTVVGEDPVVIAVMTNSDAGIFVLNASLLSSIQFTAYFISATKNIVFGLDTPALQVGEATGLPIAIERDQISVFLNYISSSPTITAHRRVYKLLTGEIINFGDIPINGDIISIPFIDSLFTGSKGYCYIMARAATVEEKQAGKKDGELLVASDAATFEYLSIMDMDGRITVVEKLDPPRAAYPDPGVTGTTLQPADFTARLKAFGQ